MYEAHRKTLFKNQKTVSILAIMRRVNTALNDAENVDCKMLAIKEALKG